MSSDRRSSTISDPTDAATIVVRTLARRQSELRRAISSLITSTYRPLEIVVVYQGIDSHEVERLRALCPVDEGLKVQVLQNPTIEDRRAENLNIGWAAGTGRYIGFLDDDDTIAPNHIADLVDTIRANNVAWAYSQTELVTENAAMKPVRRRTPFYRRTFSYQELMLENFIPINSLLIDRAALAESLSANPFFEELERSEDWDFLLRLGFMHHPAVLDEVTCKYFVSTTGRNSNTSLLRYLRAATHSAREAAWERSAAIVEERKLKLLAALRVDEQQVLLQYRSITNLPARLSRRLRLAADQWLFSLRRGRRNDW